MSESVAPDPLKVLCFTCGQHIWNWAPLWPPSFDQPLMNLMFAAGPYPPPEGAWWGMECPACGGIPFYHEGTEKRRLYINFLAFRVVTDQGIFPPLSVKGQALAPINEPVVTDPMDEFRCQGVYRDRPCGKLLFRYTGYGSIIETKCSRCNTINNFGGRALPKPDRKEPQDGNSSTDFR